MSVYLLELESGRLTSIPTSGRCLLQRHGWSPDSSHLLLKLGSDNSHQLDAYHLPSMAKVWSYESSTVRAGAFSPDGDQVVCVCVDELLLFAFPSGELLERLPLSGTGRISDAPWSISFGEPGEVYFLTKGSGLYRWRVGGDRVPVVKEVAAPRPGTAFTPEEYRITSRDGRTVPVQRFIPPNPKPLAVMYVHGGPGGRIDPSNPYMSTLLEAGFEVVSAGYRGSKGYGKKHREAGKGEYGRGDVWDLLAGAQDWKRRTGGGRPLVLLGLSYGGLLTLLALAQEEAPWSGGVVLSAPSAFHTLRRLLADALPEDPKEREMAMRGPYPLEQAAQIRAPVLMFHGALEPVPKTQELEKIRERIRSGGGECTLIVYEDDTHILPRHHDKVLSKTLDFLSSFR